MILNNIGINHISRVILLLACATSQIACGAGPGGLMVEPEFIPYLNSFQAELDARSTGIKIKNLTISFSDMPNPEAAAYCKTSNPPVIGVNRAMWPDYVTHLEKEMLMFHEFGHCILGRKHADSMIQNNVPGVTPYMGSRTCSNITYDYSVAGIYLMPISIMNPCSNLASLLFRIATTEGYSRALHKYYVDELINNRVVGFDIGF